MTIGSSLRATLERAVALHNAGRVDEAETLYRAVLSRHPLKPDALDFLGLACTQKGRPGEAARLFGQLVKLSPRHTTAPFTYARVLQDLGRLVGRGAGSLQQMPGDQRRLAGGLGQSR